MFLIAPRFATTPRDWVLPPRGWFVAPVLVCVAALSVRLWPQWTTNPDLSHGMFTPLLSALLVWEGARSGTPRWLRDSGWLTVGSVLLGLAMLALVAFASLLAASVGWSHALVNFALAAGLVCLLAAAGLHLASERVRAVPLNWPVLTALGLWVLAAPIPPGTYAKLTLTLQAWVTSGVLEALHILGVPARQIGNVIELANTSVGVEEACSGIRSLLSCLYAGFFFAAWLVRRPGRRLALIVAAPLLAIAMNYARSLALTLMANAGHDITGFWHDATGYAILGLTAAVLAGLSAAMSPASPPVHPVTPAPGPLPTRGVPGVLATSAAGAALVLFVVFYNRAPVALPEGDVAAVDQLLPASPAGWQVHTPKDLYRFSPILQTEHLAERTYLRLGADGPVQLNAYVAHWRPGQASVSVVATHTPDACWPGSGWVLQETPEPQVELPVDAGRLPVAEHRIFQRGNVPQHVWFWHVYDGRVINYRAPYSVPALLEIALEFGFRREGSQYFVRFSSNRPWEELRDDPLVREIFANFQRIGVRP